MADRLILDEFDMTIINEMDVDHGLTGTNRERPGLRDPVHAEMVAHPVKARDQVRRADRKADARPEGKAAVDRRGLAAGKAGPSSATAPAPASTDGVAEALNAVAARIEKIAQNL